MLYVIGRNHAGCAKRSDMSDYTKFTSGQYGEREVDLNKIRDLYARNGVSYYGDGSEFVCGYDADGNAMVKTDDVVDAMRRRAEAQALQERTDAHFLQMIRSGMITIDMQAYLEVDSEIIWHHEGDRIKGFQLIHREDVRCKYKYKTTKYGPFVNIWKGLDQLDAMEGFTDTHFMCPFCFAGTQLFEAFKTEPVLKTRIDGITEALVNNRWRLECYDEKEKEISVALTEDEKLTALENIIFKESELTPFTKLLGANPDVKGLLVVKTKCERHVTNDEKSNFIRVWADCMDKREPQDFNNFLVSLSVYRFKGNLPFEEFKKNSKNYTLDDFEELDSGFHLVNFLWYEGSCKKLSRNNRFCAEINIPLEKDQWLPNGLYCIALDFGDARMSPGARISLWEFTGDPQKKRKGLPPFEMFPTNEDNNTEETASATTPAPVFANPDRREYAIFGDRNKLLSEGGSKIGDVRMEYYWAYIQPQTVLFCIAINSRSELTVDDAMSINCSCYVEEEFNTPYGRQRAVLVSDEGRTSRFKIALIQARNDYPYDDAHGYYLWISFSGAELKNTPVPGDFTARFSMMASAYLKEGMRDSYQFHLDVIT